MHPTRHPPYGPDPPDDLDARVTTQPNVLSLDADFNLGMPLAKVDVFLFFVVFSNHPEPHVPKPPHGGRPGSGREDIRLDRAGTHSIVTLLHVL